MKTMILMGILALTKVSPEQTDSRIAENATTAAKIEVSPKQTDSRIAEHVATVANIEDAPFSVAIARRLFILFPHCTGTIIDPEWVLTAAHCIGGAPEDIFNIKIIAGTNKVSDIWVTEPWVQIRAARKAIFHPQYWPTITVVGRYDVAVVQVDTFFFNDRVNKANLWAKPWVEAAPNDGVEYGTLDCRAYGWGNLVFDHMGNSKTTSNLMTAPVKAVHGKKACPFEQMFRNRRIICCLERALCPGDSGGPLIWDNNTVVGVAHVIKSKDNMSPLDCDSDTIMSIWMYVCPMLDFVHKHVPSVPAMPESCSSPHHPPTHIVVLIGLCYATALVFD